MPQNRAHSVAVDLLNSLDEHFKVRIKVRITDKSLRNFDFAISAESSRRSEDSQTEYLQNDDPIRREVAGIDR